MLAMLEEDHPLTDDLIWVFKQYFVHVGGGTWCMCPSLSDRGFTLNGGVAGVWNDNGGGALCGHLTRVATAVLEVPAIKTHMEQYGEKGLWGKCMKELDGSKFSSHLKFMSDPRFKFSQYDFVERLNQNAALLCFSDGKVFDVRNQEIRSAQPEDCISSTISVSWKEEVAAVTDDQA